VPEQAFRPGARPARPAASVRIAGLLLTTEAVVSEIPDKKGRQRTTIDDTELDD
jgi:hypothetical protein